MDGDLTTYQRLLRDAFDRGRRDGRRAAAPDRAGVDAGETAWGRLDPDDLAARLWQPRSGRPPAGLPLNGPHWYAAGYRAGLQEQAVPVAVPAPRAPEPGVEATATSGAGAAPAPR